MATFLAIGVGPPDPSAGLVVDGTLVAFVEEERLTRRKHAKGDYPLLAIQSVLEIGDVGIDSVDGIVVGWDLQSYSDGTMAEFFDGVRARYPVDDQTVQWQDHCLNWFSLASQTRYHHDHLSSIFEHDALPPVRGVAHHRAHALHAVHDSGFDDALVVTLDGSGDHLCSTVSHWDGARLDCVLEVPMPHSLGWFYAGITEYLGFSAYDGEYKVMGLAPFGRPGPLAETLSVVVSPEQDGPAYCVDPTYLHYGPRSYSDRFTDHLVDRLGRPPRRGEDPIDDFHADVAYAAQSILERHVLSLVRWGIDLTGSRRVCFGGGVAHNVAMVGRVAQSRGVDEVFAHPLAGDLGVAVGAALVLEAELGGLDRGARLATLALGPAACPLDSQSIVPSPGTASVIVDDRYSEVAAALADGSLVAWCQGRMEAGPRSLGHRSILADPRTLATREKLNSVVKDRFSWQPFAPAIRIEDVDRYLLGSPRSSPYMACVYEASDELARDAPAIVHVDGTVRVQLVEEAIAPELHRLLTSFGKLTGVPVLLNTSLNRAGEPIACSTLDAVEIFRETELDALVVGRRLLLKSPSAGSSPTRRMPAMDPSQPFERAVSTLVDDMKWPAEAESIEPTTSIGPDGLGLDSIAVLELIVALEEHYGVALDLSQLGDLVSLTVGDIAAGIGALVHADRP